MTGDDIIAAVRELHSLSSNVIGFHILTERESDAPHPVDRMIYEAQAYSSGLALAYRVHELAAELDRYRRRLAALSPACERILDTHWRNNNPDPRGPVGELERQAIINHDATKLADEVQHIIAQIHGWADPSQ